MKRFSPLTWISFRIYETEESRRLLEPTKYSGLLTFYSLPPLHNLKLHVVNNKFTTLVFHLITGINTLFPNKNNTNPYFKLEEI
jgi:hypothetical protein